MPSHIITVPADPNTGLTLDDKVIGDVVAAALATSRDVGIRPHITPALESLVDAVLSAPDARGDHYRKAIALAGIVLRWACENRPVCP